MDYKDVAYRSILHHRKLLFLGLSHDDLMFLAYPEFLYMYNCGNHLDVSSISNSEYGTRTIFEPLTERQK